MSLLRHDCQKSGCFNESHRLKFDVFSDCWMRHDWRIGWRKSSISPMDVDFLIEVRANFLLQEWKSSATVFAPSTGQGIALRRLAALPHMAVILVQGQAKTMAVERVAVLSGGYDSGPLDCDLDSLRHLLRSWSKWADRNPSPAPRSAGTTPPWLEGFLKESA